jgi:hypothetical protein
VAGICMLKPLLTTDRTDRDERGLRSAPDRWLSRPARSEPVRGRKRVRYCAHASRPGTIKRT